MLSAKKQLEIYWGYTHLFLIAALIFCSDFQRMGLCEFFTNDLSPVWSRI